MQPKSSNSKIPRRINQITEYLVRLYMDNVGDTLPPPVIIKGHSGTGRSWVLNLIKQKLREQNTYNTCVINVPIQLSAKNLVRNIIEEISAISPNLMANNQKQGRKNPKQKIVLLIDNIDNLLNIEQGDQSPVPPDKVQKSGTTKFSRAIGTGAAKFNHIRDVSEFRSFLIENANQITVIASSSQDTSFMEDPEQPFFQFFNLIELKSFNSDELKEFIDNRLSPTEKDIITYLDDINFDWPTVCCEGKITYAKFIIDAVKETKNEPDTQLDTEELVRRMILLFLGKISSSIDSVFHNLSYTEKKLLDIAVYLADGFYANQLNTNNEFDGKNISQTLKTLKKKGIIGSDKEMGGYNARYKFESSTFKAYLRYYKNGTLRDILSPNKPLVIRKS